MMISAAMAIMLAQAANPPAMPTRAQIEQRAKASFGQIDANKDGWVDKNETMRAFDAAIQRRQSAAFARLDKDKNGAISRAEFDAAAGQPNEARRSAWLTVNDVDKNGRVALAEVTAKALNDFDRVDSNKDGKLSQDEIRAARRTAARR